MLSEILSTEKTISEEIFIDAPAGPAEIEDCFIELPYTTLHYVKCGEGPPLVIVPATISEITNWLPLIQFMGQRFTTYFFELPGHGKSSAFSRPFSSQLVAETVEHFIDALGYQSVAIMGFSFGGVLTMKTLFHLQGRIERVILLSPATSYQALPFSRVRLWTLRALVTLLCQPIVRRGIVELIYSERFGRQIARGIRNLGEIEDTIPLEERLRELKASTLEVLAYQMREVLHLEYSAPEIQYQQPCYFAMSVNDPLLNFDTTLQVIENQFAQVHVERLGFPYHQPPVLPTFVDLVRDYGSVLTAA